MLRTRADWVAFTLCILFVVTGSLWIGELGIQTDEALFAGGIYPPYQADILLFGKPRPLMMMDYVGALKSYLWKPIVRNLGSSAAIIRFPAVLLGGLTVWWFYLLMKQTLGIRAALTGAALLAVDTTFVLTTRWDWGPVTLQRLLTVGGVLSIVRYSESRRLAWLALGFFAFGLATWDKALFFWMFSALAVATLAIFPRRVVACFQARAVAIAAMALLIGASPLILYNIDHPFITLRQGSWAWDEDVRMKAGAFVTSLNGNGLLGSVVRDEFEGPVREPDDAFKKSMIRATEFLGSPRKSFYGFLAAGVLLLAPLVWRTPAGSALLFVLIVCAVAWLQMVFTRGAGGSPHHIGLIWPFPHLAIAAVLAQVSLRLGRFGVPVLTLVTAAACLSSMAVVGTHYRNMLRNGGVKEWTDAIYPAVQALPGMEPSYICFLDWGFRDNVRLLLRGKFDVCTAVDPAEDATTAKRQMSIPDVVYVTHPSESRLLPELTDRFVALAMAEGYRKTGERLFYDYNGRPMIEVFKLFRP